MSKKIYDFEVEGLNGKPKSLEEHKGDVLLVVNTASKCGFTPQLDALEALHKEYKDKGFKVLGFPSNQFAGQEPLEGEAIQEFCQVNYGVSFPIYGKLKVQGPEMHPLYDWLGNKKENGRVRSRVRWNFHKYLVDRNGQVVDFFLPFTKPDARRVKKAIEKYLEEAPETA